jgi:hypothetical protein
MPLGERALDDVTIGCVLEWVEARAIAPDGGADTQADAEPGD